MKTLKNLSIKVIIIIPLIIISAFCIPSSSKDIPFQAGILNGEFSVTMNQTINKVSGRTIEGQFKNNQKFGTWKLWDKNHKLLQERIYKNNFEYSIVKDKKEIAYKYPLKRNEQGIFPFREVVETDIQFAQRIWKIIPEEYLKSSTRLDYTMQRIDFTSAQAYLNDELSKKDSTNQLQSLNFSMMIGLRIMGDWFYDSKYKISTYQILAISPVIENDDRQFWFYYPDLRLSNSHVEAESELRIINNLDDVFFFNDYPSLIYKVENIEDSSFPENALLDSTMSNIEYRLMVEAAYWVK